MGYKKIKYFSFIMLCALSVPLVLVGKILARLKKFSKFTLLVKSPVVKVEYTNSSVSATYREPHTHRLHAIKGQKNIC